MRFLSQKLFLQAFFVFSATVVAAQQKWPSPEFEQMYKHAQEAVGRGNLKDAIVIYKQAILLSPDILILYKDLGKALYKSGEFAEAERTLSPVVDKERADAECYQVLAASQEALGKNEAEKTLKKGLNKFPASGLLYHEKGVASEREGRHEDALIAWIDGIHGDPEYSQNYYEAAGVYLGSDRVLWGLFYGEQYLYMAHDTTGDTHLKQILFVGYKTLFDNMAAAVPQFGTTQNKPGATTFEEAVMKAYTSLTPVVSDGITTENLTMIRTRFLMDWFAEYGKTYPFSLFTYEDNLIRSGHFDMSNAWLFGMAESAVQYDAWNKFHEGDMDRYMKWQSVNLFRPSASDDYNDRNMSGLFRKKH